MDKRTLATKDIKLPCGLKGTIFQRDESLTSENLFMHFHPDTGITIGVCAVCGLTASLEKKSPEEISHWLIKHYENSTEACLRPKTSDKPDTTTTTTTSLQPKPKDTAIIHYGVRPDRTTTSATLRQTFMGRSDLGEKARSIAWTVEDIMYMQDQGIDLTLKRSKRTLPKICLGCFTDVSKTKDFICCNKSIAKREVLFRAKTIPIIFAEENDNARIEFFVQSQTSGRSWAARAESRSKVPVWGGTKRYCAEESFNARCEDELTEEEFHCLSGGLEGANGVPFRGQSKMVIGTFTGISGAELIVVAPISTEQSRTKEIKDREAVMAVNTEIQRTRPFFAENDPISSFIAQMKLNSWTDEEILKTAKAVTIDLNTGQDRLLLKAINYLVSSHLKIISQLVPSLELTLVLHDISRAAQIGTPHGTPVADSHSFTRDFVKLNEDYSKEMVTAVAKICKLAMCSRSVISIPLINTFEAFQFDTEWASTSEEDKIHRVAGSINHLWSGLVRSPCGNVLVYMMSAMCLTIEDPKSDPAETRSSNAEDADDDEEDDGNGEEYESLPLPPKSIKSVSVEASPSQELKVSTVSPITLRKYACGIHKYAKLSFAVETLMESKDATSNIRQAADLVGQVAYEATLSMSEKLKALQSETNRAVLKSLNDSVGSQEEIWVSKYLNILEQSECFRQLAKIQSEVLKIEGSSPSQANAVRAEANGRFGTVIAVGNTSLCATNFRALGNQLQAQLLRSFVDCLAESTDTKGEIDNVVKEIQSPVQSWLTHGKTANLSSIGPTTR